MIVYENGGYWVKVARTGGYVVFKTGSTHSTRCAQIGFAGEVGLNRAKAEIDRRIAADQLKEKTK